MEQAERSKVCRALCHSSATADRFYVGESSVREAHSVRQTIAGAVSDVQVATPRKRCLPLSSDDEESEVCHKFFFKRV